MDWNNDGKVDWKDYAIYDSATSGGKKDDYSGGGTGCLTLVLVVLFAFYILDLFIKIFD